MQVKVSETRTGRCDSYAPAVHALALLSHTRSDTVLFSAHHVYPPTPHTSGCALAGALFGGEQLAGYHETAFPNLLAVGTSARTGGACGYVEAHRVDGLGSAAWGWGSCACGAFWLCPARRRPSRSGAIVCGSTRSVPVLSRLICRTTAASSTSAPAPRSGIWAGP
jgi:hypothetical protein